MLLTPEQRNAVIDDRHVCLVSCPGSGKTRVIVAKLLRCVEEVLDSSRRVACITHTNAGADEIDSRLRKRAFSGEDQFYEVRTMHSFALQNIFRPFHRELPWFSNGFTVLTSDDERFQLKRVELIRKWNLRAADADSFDQIQRLPDGSVCVPDGFSYLAGEAWCRWLDSEAFTTLNDLVFHSCQILDRCQFVASALASRFAWFLVDEFQDSSPGQVHLLKAIATFNRTKFFCVGDPNQSIYGFAGASPTLLNDFAAFVGATTEHRLTGNFRSSQRIVTVAERLCPTTPAMKAVGGHKDYDDEPDSPHDRTALDGIVNHFLPSVAALQVPLGKVAILAPTWFPLFHLARGLRERNIPVMGPGARPYKRTHEFARLAEPLGAYIESPEPEIILSAQRALFVMLGNLTGESRRDVFSYRGRVSVCEILQVASEARSSSHLAVQWLRVAAEGITEILLREGLLTAALCTSLIQSANAMAADIEERDPDGLLTVEELGIFARPSQCIQLMTIHKAKGREFEAVAVIDAHDGRLPHFSIQKLANPQIQQARYSESRRVLYVALTRAMRILRIITDGGDSRNRPSPFLRDLRLR